MILSKRAHVLSVPINSALCRSLMSVIIPGILEVRFEKDFREDPASLSIGSGSSFKFYEDPDPAFHFNADPDPDLLLIKMRPIDLPGLH